MSRVIEDTALDGVEGEAGHHGGFVGRAFTG
jgi:hypothetical protein